MDVNAKLLKFAQQTHSKSDGHFDSSKAGNSAVMPGRTSTGMRACKRFGQGDAELEHVVQTGASFGMRSALGNRLSRDLKENEELRRRYKQATDVETFKRERAEKEYDGIVAESRVHQQSHSEGLARRGRPVSFLKMCYLEGGPKSQDDEETIKACERACVRCIKLGEPYYQYDPQTDTAKYMYFDSEYKEQFESRWSQFAKQSLTDRPTATGGTMDALKSPQPW